MFLRGQKYENTTYTEVVDDILDYFWLKQP